MINAGSSFQLIYAADTSHLRIFSWQILRPGIQDDLSTIAETLSVLQLHVTIQTSPFTY